jgi:hypothetical protein
MLLPSNHQKEICPWMKLALLLLAAVMLVGTRSASASTGGDHPDREETITVSYTEYEWWLTSWADDQSRCEVYIDHEGIPDLMEIFYQCGDDLYQRWIQTAPCSSSEKAGQDCPGLYLHLANSAPRQKQVILELPEAEAWIQVINCDEGQGGYLCDQPPSLRIIAREPLPNEKILRVQGTLNGMPFACEGHTCDVPLRPTPENGVVIAFWADSSYGDSSPHYHGRVKTIRYPSGSESETSSWYVYLISDRKDSHPNTGCTGAWESFPPIGEPPQWLRDPGDEILLATDIPYTYLAGKLIQHELVDASRCPDQGFLPDGYASPCGLKAARAEVTRWQNSFDPYILHAAQNTNIPAVLLKRIFAKESQFWPETVERYYVETGFGHLTNLGADTTFLWNENFYQSYCPLVLTSHSCEKEYHQLGEDQQEMLRATLINQTNINRQLIINGIDPKTAQENILTFAETLVGTCRQIDFLIRSKTKQAPGLTSSYEDLWRFTLVGYHGGPGCFSTAMESVLADQKPLNWENISQILHKECPTSVPYVESLTQ